MTKGRIWLIIGIVLSTAFISIWGVLSVVDPSETPTMQIRESEPTSTEPEFKKADPDTCVANFEEKAKETLELYDGIKYSVNKWTVAVVIDLDKWNATSEEDRNAFMNEIYALLSVDARSSGILSDHAVSISFMTSDYKNTKVFKVEKE